MREQERDIMRCLERSGQGIYILRLNHYYGFSSFSGELLYKPSEHQLAAQVMHGIFRGLLREDDFSFEVAKGHHVDVSYRAVYTFMRLYVIKRFHDEAQPLVKVIEGEIKRAKIIGGRRFYGVPQAAELAQVSRATMYKWVYAGKAKSHYPEIKPDILIEGYRDQFTGDFCIPEESVERLKLENRITPVLVH